MELRPGDLSAEWKAGKFRPVYYLFGAESASKADAVRELKDLFKPGDFNLREFYGDPNSDYAEIISEALTLPVFADKRLVIVRSPKILIAARAAFVEYLRAPSETTTLLLLSEDRRPNKKDALAIAAGAVGATCVFSPLSEEEAVERLLASAKSAGKNLDPAAAAALVDQTGTDWGILAGELEKAVLFAGENQAISLEAVSASMGCLQAADPWAFERIVSGRDLKACLSYLSSAFSGAKPGEVAFRSLSQARAAYLKQLKAKRMLKAGMSPREIETRLRIFYDRDFFARAQRVSEQRLRRDLQRLLEVETGLKSKAWLDAKIELEAVVVGLCTPSARLS